MYKHKHTWQALCCQADGGHRPWGLMSKILADMPWKKGFVVLLHHTYIFFYTWLLSLFSSLASALFPFFFHLAEHIFQCRRTLKIPLHPPPFIPPIKRGHQLTMPPCCHLQNTNKTSFPHLSPNKEPSLSLFFSALSVLSSFSLTISCDGLRTHQLSWV